MVPPDEPTEAVVGRDLRAHVDVAPHDVGVGRGTYDGPVEVEASLSDRRFGGLDAFLSDFELGFPQDETLFFRLQLFVVEFVLRSGDLLSPFLNREVRASFGEDALALSELITKIGLLDGDDQVPFFDEPARDEVFSPLDDPPGDLWTQDDVFGCLHRPGGHDSGPCSLSAHVDDVDEHRRLFHRAASLGGRLGHEGEDRESPGDGEDDHADQDGDFPVYGLRLRFGRWLALVALFFALFRQAELRFRHGRINSMRKTEQWCEWHSSAGLTFARVASTLELRNEARVVSIRANNLGPVRKMKATSRKKHDRLSPWYDRAGPHGPKHGQKEDERRDRPSRRT